MKPSKPLQSPNPLFFCAPTPPLFLTTQSLQSIGTIETHHASIAPLSPPLPPTHPPPPPPPPPVQACFNAFEFLKPNMRALSLHWGGGLRPPLPTPPLPPQPTPKFLSHASLLQSIGVFETHHATTVLANGGGGGGGGLAVQPQPPPLFVPCKLASKQRIPFSLFCHAGIYSICSL